MNYLQILLISLTIINTAYGQTKWQTVDANGSPEKRHECAFVEVNDKFYLIGGRGMKPVNEYSPATNTWKTMATPPIEMHHFQALEYNGKVYVLGALTGGYPDEKPIPNIYTFDPEENKWTKGAEIPEARRRGAAGVVFHNDLIYLVCGIVDGHNGDYVPWLDSWDPETGKWEQLPDAPRPRDHFQAVIVDGKIFAGGGRTTSARTNQVMELTIAEVDYYDLNSGEWDTVPADIPTERAGTTSIAHNKQLIIIGGESGTQESAHNEVEAYDLNTKEWKILPTLNQGCHGTQAILTDEKVYIAAGSDNRGGGPELTSLEALNMID